MRQDELIVFTHNDLDAMGCILNIEFKMPNITKKYFQTNYANIKEKVDEIIDYVSRNKNTHILCADVSFSTAEDQFMRLYNLAKVTVIDHHLYPDGFWDAYPNAKIIHNMDKCATLLCNEYFGNKGQNQFLDKLSTLIDIYDLWQVNSPYFDFAQDLNEYYWKHDIMHLAQEIQYNDYRLPRNFKDIVARIHQDYNNALADFEKRNLIHRAGDISICFVNEWFNQILIKEMKEGKNFVIGMNNWGLVRVRISESAPYSDEQKNNIRLALTGVTDIGHMNAFTYKIPQKVNFDIIMQEIQRVATTIMTEIKT